jgi:tyrosyl-tRNA synthetase
MSKSTGNIIPIDTTPADMYGKVMSLPDFAMLKYFELLSRYTPAQIDAIARGLAEGSRHPRDTKMELAREIVAIYYGDGAVAEAEAHFQRVFQRGDLPEDMPVIALTGEPALIDFLAAHGLAASKGEARRLIAQAGVRLNGQTVTDAATRLDAAAVPAEIIIQVGKRRFVRARRAPGGEGANGRRRRPTPRVPRRSCWRSPSLKGAPRCSLCACRICPTIRHPVDLHELPCLSDTRGQPVCYTLKLM